MVNSGLKGLGDRHFYIAVSTVEYRRKERGLVLPIRTDLITASVTMSLYPL